MPIQFHFIHLHAFCLTNPLSLLLKELIRNYIVILISFSLFRREMGRKKWNGKNLLRIFFQFPYLGVQVGRNQKNIPLFRILNKREWIARKKHSLLPFPK